MTDCAACGAQSELYLCGDCGDEMRTKLLGLPALMDRLNDSAYGLTRMGDSVRHRAPGSQVPMWNASAIDLLESVTLVLRRWATDIALRHGLAVSPPVTWHRPIEEYRPTASDHAVFLAAHVAELQKSPGVGDLAGELQKFVRSALRAINRPVPPMFCGPCPSLDDDRHECGTRLMAKRGAPTVVCPTCRQEYRVEKLVNELLARADSFRATIGEQHRMLGMLGIQVDLSTLYRWADPRAGLIKPAGYLRKDGRRIGTTRQDGDTPLYRVSDVRQVVARHGAKKRGRPLGSRKRS